MSTDVVLVSRYVVYCTGFFLSTVLKLDDLYKSILFLRLSCFDIGVVLLLSKCATESHTTGDHSYVIFFSREVLGKVFRLPHFDFY